MAVSGGDELAQLSSTFNHMTERLGELHHLEAQLRRRDRLHALGEVAMGLAHEIRNPLGIIKTATQLLHRRADLPETDKRHLEYVISEVSRINDLITEFLDFAKPNPPLRVMQPARPLVEEILGFCAPELATHNIDAQHRRPGAGRDDLRRCQATQTGVPQPDSQRHRRDARRRAPDPGHSHAWTTTP